MTIPLRPN